MRMVVKYSSDMWFKLALILCILPSWITTIISSTIPGYENEKACYGTSFHLTSQGDAKSRYEKYMSTYSNCTIILGNLEITFLDDPNMKYDLSFLSQIKEVDGYVLLVSNFVDYIPLTSLRIIRGNTLYHINNNKSDTGYSLFVYLNYFKVDSDVGRRPGLKELQLTSLTEILNGQVFFQNNNELCYENTIRWEDINPTTKPPVIIKNDGNFSSRVCGECHSSCYSNATGSKHCWGEGPNMCQELSYGKVCHETCSDTRCYGSKSSECCHSECAGGCTGLGRTKCFACRNFKDNDGCVSSCPGKQIYDKNLMVLKDNPKPKFTFGSLCLKECPEFMLQDGSSCVRECGEGSHSVDQKFCKPCNGPCPKGCPGLEPPNFLNMENIKNFTGCTRIEGSLRILGPSFNRDLHYNIEPLHPHNLSVLQHVKEITGYLSIQSNHSDFTDLSFLSSLEVIHGRTLIEPSGNSLSIITTPLQSLGLISLKYISHGNVLIGGNKKLCYADTIDWKKIIRRNNQKVDIIRNKPRAECEEDGEVCEVQCGSSGCWGKGNNKCLECANFVYEEGLLCLSNCTDHPRLYNSGQKRCKTCHKECMNSCTGPNNTDCDSCVHVVMRNKVGKNTCEASCGPLMYPDEKKMCQQCHPNCGDNGCTGPGKFVGSGGCNACDLGVRFKTGGTLECLPVFNQTCGSGFFTTYAQGVSNSMQFPVCEICHEYCVTCADHTARLCNQCRYFRREDYCEKQCATFEFADETKTCQKCHSECRKGCFGPTTADCEACANFKIYISLENKTFNCTPDCPSYLPYRVREIETDDNRVVCADSSHPEIQSMQIKNAEQEKQKQTIVIVVSSVGSFFLIFMFGLIAFFCYKRSQNNRKAAEYTAKIAGVGEDEPLTPTNAKPDLSKMRIINESELKKGAIIGSGAFGTVYKGIWIPQGENVKIPVAIKILQEGTSPGQSTELLEEARVMCSVDNINCVRILAVCMKSQMMLVTQLMPHGNLLNYVRTNAQHIGSKILLNWCTQIARGMAYLEERGIVHRDLAARNVLVQTPTQVKITDFGLAKLLDMDAPEYHSQGGLMPIKWLALECILNRIFTHKSDVWSYGVTIWELFTLGKKPYDGIRTKDVPMLLEKGERLQQPMICTIDVYMIMVKCWMLDAESRPSFKELQEEFAKMSRDPGRYLVIEGDSLMRLPSVSYDKNELVQELGGGGSESVMDADEYLRPVESHPHRPGSSSRPLDRQTSNLSTRSMRSDGGHGDFSDGAKNNSMGRENLKIRDKMYGHLTAAARAKQERELPNQRGSSVSSRYSSDPIKFVRDKEEIDWNQSVAGISSDGYPLKLQSPTSIKNPVCVVLPVDEEDYLRPGAAAQSLAYLDLDGKGYYQNEKEIPRTKADVNDTTDALDRLIYYSHADNDSDTNPYPLLQNQNLAVANPDYFEEVGEEAGGEDVWTPRHQKNGYHPIPNGPSSPAHVANKVNPNSYFKIVNGNSSSGPPSAHVVNTQVTLPGLNLNNSTSMV